MHVPPTLRLLAKTYDIPTTQSNQHTENSQLTSAFGRQYALPLSEDIHLVENFPQLPDRYWDPEVAESLGRFGFPSCTAFQVRRLKLNLIGGSQPHRQLIGSFVPKQLPASFSTRVLGESKVIGIVIVLPLCCWVARRVLFAFSVSAP